MTFSWLVNLQTNMNSIPENLWPDASNINILRINPKKKIPLPRAFIGLSY